MRTLVEPVEPALRREIRQLRGGMRDLVALSSLSAVWVGLDAPEVAHSLARALVGTLGLDMVYARLGDGTQEEAPEALCCQEPMAADALHALREGVVALAGTHDRAELQHPALGTLRLVMVRFGGGEDRSVLVAGSTRTDFATELDRALLSVCANQAAVVLQRRRGERQLLAGQEALREHRARLETAVRAGEIATWTWDIPANRLFADQTLARLFGLDQSLATGGSLDAYTGAIHPEDLPQVQAALAASVETGKDYEAEYRVIQPDGAVRWVNARGRVERDDSGQPLRMPGVLMDITERKRLEQELRQKLAQLDEAGQRREELMTALGDSEQKLRLLADTIPQLAWMARPDGHIFWYNRRWFEYTGTTPEDMQGWGWQEVHDPRVLPEVLAGWKASLATGEPFEMVFPLRGADGRLRPFLTRGNPWRDEQGRVLYWCGTNTDISEIKRMEESLRETDRRKDEFLATLAHELRNPLAPIRNSLQILKMRRVDAGTAQQIVGVMERQLHQLVRLVDDLLDVSRVMRGKIELRREPLELAVAVARGVETAQPLIDLQRHELELRVDAESLLVHADPVRLAQVVGNLLTNSAKYTEPGGSILLTASREGRDAVLTVTDNGIGMAPDLLPRVFGLFVQADHAATRAQGGLGIGLTLVRNLVEMHHGTVVARSAGPGQGSEFEVRLPLLAQAREPEAAKAAVVTGAVERCRVLVVDDNVDAADSLAMLLDMQGHDVRVVHEGGEALEAVREFRPRLVLLDLGMPRMDGFEVAQRIRASGEASGVVLAALTGWGQRADRQRTAAAGFDHHLVKPVEPAVLEQLLAGLGPARPAGG